MKSLLECSHWRLCNRNPDSPVLLILFSQASSHCLCRKEQGNRAVGPGPFGLRARHISSVIKDLRTTGACSFIPPIALGVGAVHTQKQGQALASFLVAADQGCGHGVVDFKASPAPSSPSASSWTLCHHVAPGPVPGNVPGVDW